MRSLFFWVQKVSKFWFLMFPEQRTLDKTKRTVFLVFSPFARKPGPRLRFRPTLPARRKPLTPPHRSTFLCPGGKSFWRFR
jgi:hypothetical protein